MKWLFILLLLVNVLYFGWELDRQTRINISNSVAPLTVPVNVKKLVLLRELETPPVTKKLHEQEKVEAPDNTEGEDAYEQSSAEQVTDAEQLTTDVMIEKEFSGDLVSRLPDISADSISQVQEFAKPLCFSYGPFPDDKQAGNLREWFDQRQILVNRRIEKEQAHKLFWIYLAPRESTASAIAAIEDLKSKGIKDYRLINTGDLRNAISLGLFSTQAIVNRRLNELKNKGYQPIVVPYHNTKVIYWIDVKLVNQQNLLNDMFTDYPSRFNSVPMNCSEIALL